MAALPRSLAFERRWRRRYAVAGAAPDPRRSPDEAVTGTSMILGSNHLRDQLLATHRLSVHVAAPPDRVFDLWIDLDRMKEWVGGVTRVTDVSGPVDRVGTRYTVWFGGMRSPTEVLEAERPRRFRTRFGNWVLRGEASATFEPEGDGTRLVEEFRTQGWIAAVAAWIFARGSYRGSFQQELNAFARLAEAPPR